MRHTQCFLGSKQWFQRQVSDGFVHQAAQQNYVARSAFKLKHIDDKFKILKRSSRAIIDLGCSPGSWCQVITERVNPECVIVGVDLNAMKDRVPNTVFVQGDFTVKAVQDKIEDELGKRNLLGKIDVVLSDMSPNRSGNISGDIHRIASLNEKALRFAISLLAVDGHFVCKVLGSNQAFKQLEDLADAHFKEHHFVKPPASRKESAENFMVCMHKVAEPKLISRYKTKEYDLDNWPGLKRRP